MWWHTRRNQISSFALNGTSPFNSVGKGGGRSVQSTAGSRGVRISGSNAGHIMFRGSVKGTGYPLHSPVSPSLPLPCAIVCHHISTGLYKLSSMPFLFHPLFMSSVLSHKNGLASTRDINNSSSYSVPSVFTTARLYCFRTPLTLQRKVIAGIRQGKTRSVSNQHLHHRWLSYRQANRHSCG